MILESGRSRQCGSPHTCSRLCRLMCGRPVAFRSFIGYSSHWRGSASPVCKRLRIVSSERQSLSAHRAAQPRTASHKRVVYKYVAPNGAKTNRASVQCGQGCLRAPNLPSLTLGLLIQSLAMKPRRLLFSILTCLLVLAFITSAIPSAAQRTNQRQRTTTQPKRPPSTATSARDEALYQRTLAIHRPAIVVQ